MTDNLYINSLEFYKGVTIVRMQGEVVGQTLPDVKQEFSAKTKDKDIKNILFDLDKVSDTDTAGVAGLIELFRYMKKHQTGDKIGLINVPKKVNDLFDISGTGTLFMGFETEEEAIKALG